MVLAVRRARAIEARQAEYDAQAKAFAAAQAMRAQLEAVGPACVLLGPWRGLGVPQQPRHGRSAAALRLVSCSGR